MREPPVLTLSHEHLRDSESSEWIDVNGLGGYASSTVSGENTRRYHGLFVASSTDSLARHVLLSRLDETFVFEDGERIELGVRRYRDVILPDGSRYLESFSQGLCPQIEWSLSNKSSARIGRVEKSLMMLEGENTLLIRYRLKGLAFPGELLLEPFVANRFFHETRNSSAVSRPTYRREGESVFISDDTGVHTFALSVPGAAFRSEPDWFYRLYYEQEDKRGHEAEEDLFRPGVFALPVRENETIFLAVSAEPGCREIGRDEIMQLWADEEARRRDRSTALAVRSSSSLEFYLSQAAQSFLIRRRESHEHPESQYSLIAGYHWFGDWGRDALISLPGVLLATESFEVIKEILHTFSVYVKEGLVPNRFSDSDGEAEYNSVDASLWFVVNGFYLLEQVFEKEQAFITEVFLPTARKIIEAFSRGTHFHIHACVDGLIAAGAGEEQVTWMDARVDGRAITPRHGKPVEVNALWINALWCFSEVLRKLGQGEEADALRERAFHLVSVYQSVFWNEDEGGLFDVVSEEGEQDPAIRPNQIFSIALPLPLLPDDKAKSVLRLVERELVTPVGLRTLSRSGLDYCGRYEGDVPSRDHAYHQGTVWPWLLGAYARAVVRYGTDDMIQRAIAVVFGFEEQVKKYGIGTIGEIFDGDSPHRPRGCISQLWSVSELLSALTILKKSQGN